MKIYQITVTIFYEGNRSQGDIGILKIQLETDNLIMQSRNSYDVGGQRDIIPVNITTIDGTVKDIEETNIKKPHDFEYEVTNEHLKLRIKGWHVYYKTELVEL